MKRVSALWRRLYKSGIAFFYRRQAIIIQKVFKRWMFFVHRERAAAKITRVYRGHVGRSVVRAIIRAVHNGLINRIKRLWRKYKERRQRRFVFAKRHIAARRIQVSPPTHTHSLSLSLSTLFYPNIIFLIYIILTC